MFIIGFLLGFMSALIATVVWIHRCNERIDLDARLRDWMPK